MSFGMTVCILVSGHMTALFVGILPLHVCSLALGTAQLRHLHPNLKGHWTSSTSSPNFFQKRWDFYTVRSADIGNNCMPSFTF